MLKLNISILLPRVTGLWLIIWKKKLKDLCLGLAAIASVILGKLTKEVNLRTEIGLTRMIKNKFLDRAHMNRNFYINQRIITQL